MLEVDDQHLSRTDASAAHNLAVLDVEHAHFGGDYEEPVPGDEIACRAEPVAVESRAGHAAVGEGDEGGTVPRLHERGLVVEERSDLRLNAGLVLPYRRNEQRHGVRELATGHRHDRERVVETGRVAHVVGELDSSRQHTAAVAADCVDLAVVGDEAERLRHLPRREGVRTEPLVSDGEGRSVVGMAEVGIERGEVG